MRRRTFIRVLLVPFALQLCILFILCSVEYDWFGILPTGLWTTLRILCWLGSLFGAFALQVYLFYRSELFPRVSRAFVRLLVFGALSFVLTVVGLICGHFLFMAAGHGLLFD